MNNLQYITLSELIYSVKDDLPSLKDATFIDESRLIKVILRCNEKLGIPIRSTKETVLKVRDFKTNLPVDFDKVIYVAALSTTGFGLSQYRDPFDNFVDQTDPNSIQIVPFNSNCQTDCISTIRRKTTQGFWHNYTNWTELSLSPSSYVHTTSNCVNNRVRGQYVINVTNEEIETPFKEADLYIMYYSALKDEKGNILVPFHPLITEWYEWCVKEKILLDMAMNSDADVGNKLKLAQSEKTKAFLDAWGITLEPTYKELYKHEKQKEMEMYNKYFRHIL